MGWASFANHFPMTYGHLDRFHKGMPHQKFAKKGSNSGRKACRDLALKKIAFFPLQMPFLTGYSAFISVLKILEVSGRLIMLLKPTKKHINAFVIAGKQSADYLMLTGLLPVKIIAEIVKLIAAMIFGSHLYFCKPESYSFDVQIDYYKNETDGQFYQFRFARKVTLQIKAEIREIEHMHGKIFKELMGDEEKIAFLKRFSRILKKIDPETVASEDLNSLRQFCLKNAKKAGIKIVFKTPQSNFPFKSRISVEVKKSNIEEEGSSSETDFYSFNSSSSG